MNVKTYWPFVPDNYFTRLKKMNLSYNKKIYNTLSSKTQISSDIIVFYMKFLLLLFNICTKVMPEQQLSAL